MRLCISAPCSLCWGSHWGSPVPAASPLLSKLFFISENEKLLVLVRKRKKQLLNGKTPYFLSNSCHTSLWYYLDSCGSQLMPRAQEAPPAHHTPGAQMWSPTHTEMFSIPTYYAVHSLPNSYTSELGPCSETLCDPSEWRWFCTLSRLGTRGYQEQ